MNERRKYKNVVISDVHLGSEHSKLAELTGFLSSIDCERLILAGDIIDGYQLHQKQDRWTYRESSLFRVIMKMMEAQGTEVIYVTGNHDDFLDSLAPSRMFNISIVNEFIVNDFNKKYVVIHGHAFDSVTLRLRWLARLGDMGYNMLIRFNKVWNKARRHRGAESYSLSKAVKHGVKKAVAILTGFEKDLADFAFAKGCDGIICGHIHHTEDKILRHNIHYLNSGDWVETMSALVQTMEGEWKVLYYKDLQ